MLKINEAAARLGVSARTIRFYEEKGLLAPSKLPHNGYRLYSEADLLRLQTILALRESGLSLADLRTVLETYGMEENEELLYLLELQRSLLFAKRLDLEGQIRMNDRLIDAVKTRSPSTNEALIGNAHSIRKERELRNSWKDHYRFDEQAGFFDKLLADHNPEYPGYEEVIHQLVEGINPKPSELGLDLGTGTGNLAGALQTRGCSVKAVDQSKEMLRICRRKYPSMETKLGNLLSIPYFEGTFDFAAASYVLHRLQGDQRLAALKEIIRVLKPHGRIGAASPMPQTEWQPLTDWLNEAGFTIRLQQSEGVHILLATKD